MSSSYLPNWWELPKEDGRATLPGCFKTMSENALNIQYSSYHRVKRSVNGRYCLKAYEPQIIIEDLYCVSGSIVGFGDTAVSEIEDPASSTTLSF